MLAGLTAAGCDLGGAGTSPAETAPDGSPSPTSTTAPSVADSPDSDPDAALVETVRGELAHALELVTAAGRARPALTGELAPFRRLHRRHLAALPGDPVEVPTPRVAGGVARVRTAVGRRERQLQRQLGEAAVSSESGPLASLLASMSAAVAQQRAAQEGA